MARRGGRRFRQRLLSYAFGSPIYGLTLPRRAPNDLACTPVDPWPGDAERGSELLRGVYRLAGGAVSDERPPWFAAEAGEAFLAALHGFEWLRELRALGGDGGRRRARQLVDDWLTTCDRWEPLAWRGDVLGARIANWLGGHDFFIASADDAFRQRVFASLVRQVHHLARILPGELTGVPLLVALKGLVQGALALPEADGRVAAALALVERELAGQVLPDGGHVDRNPATTLTVLRHLVDLRTSLRLGQAALPRAVTVPEVLQYAIDRMAPAVRFFRHGDGALAVFNGGTEQTAILVDTTLAQADARGRPLKSARHSGYERVLAGRTLVVADVGGPPPEGFDADAHVGPLAFELSVGRERMIVNCGAVPSHHGGQAAGWHAALRSTAAHSTLTLADTNALPMRSDGALETMSAAVAATRVADADGTVIDASHAGYRAAFGFVHRRRLRISPGGDQVRGEDGLTGDGSAQPFVLRFHLHPTVRASLLHGGDALLRLPAGSGWRFRANGGPLRLEDSVYLGRQGERRASRQLVIDATTAPGGAAVTWELARERR